MADFNPFDKLFEQESLPPEHKREVMKTIDTLKLMADMVDLFSIKQARTETSLLGHMLNRKGTSRNGGPRTGTEKDSPSE